MKKIETLAGVVAAIALGAMMVIAVIDVVGRQVFNKPLNGATELTEVCMMLVSFLLFPFVALRRAHIKVDLLEHLFSRAVLAAQTVVTGILGAGIFALLGYRLCITGNRSLGYGDVTMGLEIPLGYLYWTMGIFSLLTALGFLASIVVRPSVAPKSDTDSENTMVGTI